MSEPLPTIFAIAVLLAWAISMTGSIYDTAIISRGRSSARPTVLQCIFSTQFLVFWGVPSLIFLAIFGGIFWW